MIILFDGICNLCNSSVRFIIKHDKRKVFKFASLQSSYGKALSLHFNLPSEGFETFVFYTRGKIYTESNAVVKIASQLGGLWKITSVLNIIPRFIRNSVYRLVAKNRYKLFGKKDICMVPTDDVKDRFVDNLPFTAPETIL